MKKNKFDRNGECLAMGMSAEKMLVAIAEHKGCTVRKASKNDDMRRHIDYFLTTPAGKEVSIDVKAMKKTSRKDNEVQDTWIWIEFKNVRGNDGWLYGDADSICFEMKEHFMFVNRQELIKLCKQVVDMNSSVSQAYLAKRKLYTRRGREDLLTQIHINDILSPDSGVNYKLWRKVMA